MENRYLKNVVTLRLFAEKCVGCGRCLEVCPRSVFFMKNEKAVIADRDSCIECGACVKNCPFNALEVQSGVGCAAAIIRGWLTGTEPACGCSDGGAC